MRPKPAQPGHGRNTLRLIPRTALALAFLALVPANAGAASLASCAAGLKKQALRNGVKRSVADKAFAGIKFDEKVIRFSRSQPEYRTPIWDYMAFLVDPERIADGKAMMKKHDRTLRAVEKKYGVDRYIIAALWGIESNYGRHRGDFFLPHALTNLVCAGRKSRFFRRELLQALKIVSRGDVRLKDLTSSWAGAFGQTQFIPSTYRRLAVDFDKDGRRDLVRSIPDALASTANFLRNAGWRSGQGWGYEVRLPKGYRGTSGRKRRASLSTWGKRGITRLSGKRLAGSRKAALILPAGRKGPAFIVYRNFNAIYSYNAAESYALAISHLSDRLKGRPAIAKAWPTSDPGLTRAQRLELQKLLIKAGYDIGEADGRIGPITKKAIKKVQRKHKMKANGRPSMKVYKHLGGT
ncbi:MAG: lytic murein transglycosylase [Rhizobiales bacterium]|nr:lytic murein transglycosylase [Hyphomicrobiales bacterium]